MKMSIRRPFSILSLALATLLATGCGGDAEPPSLHDGSVAGVLSIRVQLAHDVPVRGSAVFIHAADGRASGPGIDTDADGFGASHRAVSPDSELRVQVQQDGVSGTLRARIPQWDGVTPQAIDPFTTLQAAWLDANPSKTLAEANRAVRTILGIPERVPDDQLLTATKWFSARIFVDDAAGDLDRLIAEVVALPASSTPRFADPAGQDVRLKLSTTSVVSWLVTKAKDNAFAGIFGIAQFGVGLYTKDQEQEALQAQFNQVNQKLNELHQSLNAVAVTSSAGLTALNCSAYSSEAARFVNVDRYIDQMRRWEVEIERVRLTHKDALPDLILYPLGADAVAALNPEQRARYDQIPASTAYRDLTDFRRMKAEAFALADAEAERVGFPSRLVGDPNSPVIGTMEMLNTCISLDRSYLKATDQQLVLNEVALRQLQAAFLLKERLAVFDAHNAKDILEGRAATLISRDNLVKRLEAISTVLTLGTPNHIMEASSGLDGKPAEVWLLGRNVVLRVAEQAPIHAFDGMIHAAKAAGQNVFFDDGRHAYRYVNFDPANTRGERMLGADEHVLLETASTPRELQKCSGGTVSMSCPGTLRDWLLHASGGVVGQDRANLDRFDLFRRSVALAGLGRAYSTAFPGGARAYYDYYHAFDLDAWQRKKVILYNDDRNNIRSACLGGWTWLFGGGLRDWQEYPNPRPFTIPPPDELFMESLTQKLFADSRSSACVHSTRDHFGSRLMTVRPADNGHLLWSESAAKAELRRLGLVAL